MITQAPQASTSGKGACCSRGESPREARAGGRAGRQVQRVHASPCRSFVRAPPNQLASRYGWSHSTARVAAEYEAATSSDESASFYELLGVLPSASEKEIKAAYRRMVKEYHPDLSSGDEDSTEFQVFLNEVYETLLDPDRRAAYDAIAGFDVGGINPFLDTSFPADQVFVDEFSCIGCRNCNNVCPKTFSMEDEYGRARVMQQGADSEEMIQEAIDTCPVSCIHWVTAPQLAVLEVQMSKMERVAAWLLMTGGGKGANLSVFQEAAMAWEKRQAALRARAQAATAASWASAFTPATGSNMEQSAKRAAEANASTTPGSGGLGRRANAASIAAAARKWRDYQRARRQRERKLLSSPSSPT